MKLMKAITKGIGRTTLFLKRHKSEIMLGAGLIGNTTGVILACRASTKLEKTIDEAKTNIDSIHAMRDDPESKYPDKDYKRDLTKAYISSAGSIAKLYALPTALICLSDASIAGSHVVLRKENIALTGAYMALAESYKMYRKRVIDCEGKDKDVEYMHGLRAVETGTVKDEETGEEVKAKTYYQKGDSVSVYAKVFDESNPNWNRNPERNLSFLKMVQNDVNDILHARGHIFLNEVYKMLGFKETTAGQIVGWVDGHGDSYVDFLIYDFSSKPVQDFINGLVDYIQLDFNVDGPIIHPFEGWEKDFDPIAWNIDHEQHTKRIR